MRGVLGRCRCRCNVVLRTFFAPPPLWAVGIVCLMWVCNLLLHRQRAAARVAAAAVARQWLAAAHGVEVLGWVASVADIEADVDVGAVTREAVEAHPTRCPDASAAAAMEAEATVICAPGDGVPPAVLLSTPQSQYLFNVPEGEAQSLPRTLPDATAQWSPRR